MYPNPDLKHSMTQNGQRLTPLRAAKEIYMAFGEQTSCMSFSEMFEHIDVIDATDAEQLQTTNANDLEFLENLAARWEREGSRMIELASVAATWEQDADLRSSGVTCLIFLFSLEYRARRNTRRTGSSPSG
jgi:hypothetical protein